MDKQTDSQLLRAYAEHRVEPAFTELVRRHVDFVYSAGLRMVCDSHLAKDVTQGVFVALANNAALLADRPVLSGWLHRTAQNIAAQTVRTDVRRRAREQEAAVMNKLLAAETDASWENIAAHLDAGLGELDEADRDALLLRYFERKSAREMAQILCTSEDAAQKRVSRAVERLREFFSKRNVTIGASGLAVLISANAVKAAPANLAVAITEKAIATTTTVTVTKAIIMTTLQKTVVIAAIFGIAGTGIYEVVHLGQKHESSPIVARTANPEPPNSTGDYVPREQLSYAGYATPESTIKSLLWIQCKGDFKATLESASPRFRGILEQALKAAPKGEATIVNSIVSESKNYLGYRITGIEKISDDKVVVSVLLDDARLKQIAPGDNGYSTLVAKSHKRWQLVRINFEWKYDGGPDAPKQ